MVIHAEISIVTLGPNQGTSLSNEVAAAFEAINRIQGIKANLTALGTIIEAESLEQITASIMAAHHAARSAGAERIVSSVRIDERFDKVQSLTDKVESVNRRLSA